MDRLRSRGAFWLTRSSPMYTSPDVMSSSPTIIRRSVDFPQPDGPTRIMNSPSEMSRLLSFTAGQPSPYFLTAFLMVIGAMVSRSPLESALDCASSEAGDDSPLEEEHDDDDRHGHHHRRRRDRSRRRLELRGAGEERQCCRHRAGALGRGQRDAEDEVVPREEERQD